MKPISIAALSPLLVLLSGCGVVVLDPSGDVAGQQRDLLLYASYLMLLIIVPVMVLTGLFAWRYRRSNPSADYQPDWDHSTQLELIIWGAPLLIIICLGALTWMGTHLLDPYRPLSRLAAGKPLTADVTPLEVEVVALDWKWLFIYPQYGIATVNDLAAPVDRPIKFRITAVSVMNSFYIPALAGQIYAMPGMETTLYAVINKAGVYRGFSANFSGDGFSGMHFAFDGMSDGDFDQWVEAARSSGGRLERADYLKLAQPSGDYPVTRFGTIDPKLYRLILNMCVEAGKMCADEMMRIDAKGGLGLAGIDNLLPLAYDKFSHHSAVFGPEPSFTPSLCDIDSGYSGLSDVAPLPSVPDNRAPQNALPMRGAGLRPPFVTPSAMPSISSIWRDRRPSQS